MNVFDASLGNVLRRMCADNETHVLAQEHL